MNISDLENKIINADCLDILKQLPDKSVDLILNDPPYRQEAHGRGLAGKRKIYKEMAKWTSLDNNWFTDDFLDLLVSKCVYPNVCQFGGKRDILPFLQYAEKKGYNYFVLPLCKKNPMPMTNNTWLSNEYLMHLTDRKIECSKRYADKIPYFITGNEKETSHPNEKKIKDIERIIINLTNEGDMVLDCFSGSGTVAIACHNLKRRFICVEKDFDYWKASCKRLEDHQRQGVLF